MAGPETAHVGEAARRLTLTAALATLFLLASVALPASAHAAIPTSVEDVIRQALQALVGGGEGSSVRSPMVHWLVTTPNYPAAGGNLAELGRITSAIGLAALGAVVTLTVVHFWATGVSSANGGADIVQGVTRTAGAGLFIAAWPWVFENGVAVANHASGAVLGGETDAAARTLADGLDPARALSEGGGALLIGVMLAVPAALSAIVLSITKIALNGGIALCYVAVPLAAAFWPLPGFAWIAQFTLRACTAIALVPTVWALLLAAVVAVGVDTLSDFGGDGRLSSLATPLVALALAILMFKVPGILLRAAGVAPQSGVLKTAAAFAASRFAFGAIARHVPDAYGGTRDSIARQRLLEAQREGGGAHIRGAHAPRDSRHGAQGTPTTADRPHRPHRDLDPPPGAAPAQRTRHETAPAARREPSVQGPAGDARQARAQDATNGRGTEPRTGAIHQPPPAQDAATAQQQGEHRRGVGHTQAGSDELARPGAEAVDGASSPGWTPPPADWMDVAAVHANALSPDRRAALHGLIDSGAGEPQIGTWLSRQANQTNDPVERAALEELRGMADQRWLSSGLALWSPPDLPEPTPPSVSPAAPPSTAGAAGGSDDGDGSGAR